MGPGGSESSALVTRIEAADVLDDFDAASADFRFAAAVAEFGEILRESTPSEGERLDDVAAIIRGTDIAPASARAELLDLVERAR